MTRILLVDDNDSDHELLALVFSERSPEVSLHHVVDGEQALQLLHALPGDRSGDFDLILLDLHLPLVNGLDVLARIKAEERFAGMPVVILTTSDRPSDRESAQRSGADGYLIKPADYHGYVDTAAQISDFLDRHRYRIAAKA